MDEKILDLDGALARLDHDKELYVDVAQVFFDDTPTQLSNLKAAFDGEDQATLKRLAHSTKSAAANIGADKMRYVAAELETHAHESPDVVEPLIKSLEACFEELKAEVGRDESINAALNAL